MKRAFVTAWVLSHLVYLYAYVHSDMPNQLHWSMTGFVFVLGCCAYPNYSPLGYFLRTDPRMGVLLGFIGLYIGGYLVVSLWEVVPGTTVLFGSYELINIVEAMNAFILGRALLGREIVETHARLGVYLILATVAQFILTPDISRFGYGAQLMMCLPALLLMGRPWTAALGLLVMLASQHRTTLGAAMLACTVVLLWGRMAQSRTNRYLRGMVGVAAVAVSALVASVLSPQIVGTLARFLPEHMEIAGQQGSYEDLARVAVEQKSLEMWADYWVQGMGYTNFYAETERTSNTLYAVDRFGQHLYGVNLHNSFMTWSLEGGLIVTAIVLLLFWSTGKRIAFIGRRERYMGVLMVAWCAAGLLLGMFHQLHASVQFWATLGIVFGYREQLQPSAVRVPAIAQAA